MPNIYKYACPHQLFDIPAAICKDISSRFRYEWQLLSISPNFFVIIFDYQKVCKPLQTLELDSQFQVLFFARLIDMSHSQNFEGFDFV